MTRDYKKSPKRSARGGGSGRNVFTGIVIGLLLGIIVALGVTLYVNRAPSPFVTKVQQPEPKKPVESKKPEIAKSLESSGQPPVAKPAEKPRFDFYEMLPGDKDPSRRPAEKAPIVEKSVPAEKTVKETPSTAPEPVKQTASKDSYYLQAGSFRSATDADNLKARLALMGVEASVAPADVPNVGTMYRVRIGPYKSSDQMNSTKTQLTQNGIQASVVKLAVGQTN